MAYVRRVASQVYAAQKFHPSHLVASVNRRACQSKLYNILALSSPLRETAVLFLGDLGRHSMDSDLCSILEMLLQQLGSPSAPLGSLAFTEVRISFTSK